MRYTLDGATLLLIKIVAIPPSYIVQFRVDFLKFDVEPGHKEHRHQEVQDLHLNLKVMSVDME